MEEERKKKEEEQRKNVKMKISIQTLKRRIYQGDAMPNETINELKTRITSQFDVGFIKKVVHQGKILELDSTVSQCGITEGHKIVIITKKKKTETVWECNICTVINSVDLTICEGCEEERGKTFREIY